jgi:hypothetical protein
MRPQETFETTKAISKEDIYTSVMESLLGAWGSLLGAWGSLLGDLRLHDQLAQH